MAAEPDRERDAPAVEHAREQILAEIVGAERMLPRRPLQPRGEIDVVDRRPPDAAAPSTIASDHHDQDDSARDRQPVAAEAPPRVAATARTAAPDARGAATLSAR